MYCIYVCLSSMYCRVQATVSKATGSNAIVMEGKVLFELIPPTT